jgi:hypothetical protein
MILVRVKSNSITPIAWFPEYNAKMFSNVIDCVLAASLRGRGVLYKDPSGDRVSAVITRNGESIGVFETIDWKAAVGALRTELEALKVAQFSMIGRLDNDEESYRTVWPENSPQDMTPIFEMFKKWSKESRGLGGHR